MGLEVYYSQDIQNAILAAEQSMSSAIQASSGGEFSLGYEQGYRAALETLALAFGLIGKPKATQPSQAWIEGK